MDGLDLVMQRGADGRWLSGQSGNPRGMRPGTRNRASLLAKALGDGEAKAILRIVVEQALEGDGVAARFCLSRLFAPPCGRTIRLDLSPGAGPGDAVAAFNAMLAALATGEITPDEALTVVRFLEGRKRTLEAWEKERDLTTYKQTIPGDAACRAARAHSAAASEEPAAISLEPSPACGGGQGGGSLHHSGAAGASSDIPRLDPPPQAGAEEETENDGLCGPAEDGDADDANDADDVEDRRSPEIEAQIAEFRKTPKQNLQFACIAALQEGKVRPEAIRYLARRLDVPLPPDLGSSRVQFSSPLVGEEGAHREAMGR